MSLAFDHFQEIRNKLRNPPNAVPDPGINLRRERPIGVKGRPGAPRVAPLPAPPPSIVFIQPEPEPVLAIEERVVNVIPTVRDIVLAVSRHSKVMVNDIMSPRRDMGVVPARQIAFLLARILTSQSLPTIGRLIGGRDHSTVLHANRKLEPLRDLLLARMDAAAPLDDWVSVAVQSYPEVIAPPKMSKARK